MITDPDRPRHNTAVNGAEVIEMERFRSGKSLSPIRQAEAYWSALRHDGEIPHRTQIDPRGLGNFLAHTFVAERIAPGVAWFRLAGQHLAQVAGTELRGLPVSLIFAPGARTEIAAILEHVFYTPAVAELSLHATPAKPSLFATSTGSEARMILLPLQSDLGVVNRALGVLVADRHVEPTGGSDAMALRFDITGTALRPVSGAPHNRQINKVTEAAHGFAEAQSALSGCPPHLRLVKS